MFFNWSIIALQCCVSLCCTMKYISYKYIHIPSLLSLPPQLPPPLSHSCRSQSAGELPVLYSRFPLAICVTHGNVYMSILISQYSQYGEQFGVLVLLYLVKHISCFLNETKNRAHGGRNGAQQTSSESWSQRFLLSKVVPFDFLRRLVQE